MLKPLVSVPTFPLIDDKHRENLLTTGTVATGSEPLRLRREMDEHGSQPRRRDVTRRESGRIRQSITTSPIELDEEDEDPSDSFSDCSLSEGSVIVVASRR